MDRIRLKVLGLSYSMSQAGAYALILADEQVHRDERHLVEHEHREEVDRNEEPEDAHAQQAEPEEIYY